MDKKFDFKQVEEKIYQKWEKSGAFTPKIQKGKKPYVIIMPPPNAYDQLHIGHALEVALQDVMIRYHRLLGEPTLWLPGADHAGLASQVFFEKVLNKEKGISRHDLGRDKFVEELAKWQAQKRKDTEAQLKQLGASCDWSRKKYTLDPDISRAVVHTFKKMYDEGLIYRGERIINWCPRCATGLSDLEVEHKETEGQLTYIKYPLKNSDKFVTVATTRPETMLGDTAVAVNPQDKRFKDLVGRILILPLADREIPVVADDIVDMEFGTGAVKVTPAHDPVDFEIGKRHKLERIVVIGQDARMTNAAGKYAGLKIAEAREKIIDDLNLASLIEKQAKYDHNVGHCEKCKATVEPLISKQWFVKIRPLAELAIEAVRSGRIKFLPKRFEKVYFNWMENIHDWNISRQVWWGHQIPVWYCQTGKIKNEKLKIKNEGSFIVSKDRPKECPFCKKCKMVQDEDTLDTWFSSGLWPFTTLGWPEKTEDFKYFYPTSVMAPGWDIIFFWVARMIMMGLYCTGEIPFEYVYLHGLVRDGKGKKISRSKGNIIDPLEMVKKYGADALRMGLMMGAAIGNDTNISEDKIRAYRNFANKIWNAARFINMKSPDAKDIRDAKLGRDDKKIVDEFNKKIKEITQQMDKYQLAMAGEMLYQYFWHRFCDYAIEDAKSRLEDEQTKESAGAALNYVLKNSLIMLHPFVPFVTEAVWQELYSGQLIVQKWPK